MVGAVGRAADRVGETVARGIIARAAKSALRDAEVNFGRHAAKDGLEGSAKDILKRSEAKAVGQLGQDARTAAGRVFEDAAKNEPSITERLSGLVGTIKGGKLAGLEFSRKSSDSLLRKVAMDVADGTPVREATAGINDAVRYTIKSSRSDYTRVAQEAIEKMKGAGFTPVSMKNFWGKEGYQGINTVWRDASGQHFHTLESLSAKESTHEIYEMARVFPDGSNANEGLTGLQNRVFGKVHPAPGAQGVTIGGG